MDANSYSSTTSEGIQVVSHNEEYYKIRKEMEAYQRSKIGQYGMFTKYFLEMDDGGKSMLKKALDLRNLSNDQYAALSDETLQLNTTDAKINGSFKKNNKSTSIGTKVVDEVVNKGSIDEINKQLAEARKKYDAAATDELRSELFKVIDDLEAQKIELDIVAKYGELPLEKLNPTSLLTPSPANGEHNPIPLPNFYEKPAIKKSDIDLNNAYAESLNAIGNTLGAITNMTDDSTSAWLNWGATVLASIASAIPAISALTAAKQAEASASAQAAGAGAASAVAGIPVVGPIMALAAIASVVAALASMPKMANGGLVYGNSIVNVGEYAGASSNPEVIAPLNKLKQLIKPEGNNSVMAGEVIFRVNGKELQGVLNNYNAKTSKVR